MRVQDILRGKDPRLVTISPDATLREAAATITDERVGMLLVVGVQDELLGLLAERDIVRFIAARGETALKSPVRVAMANNGLIAMLGDPISGVMREITNRRARHVPVMSEGKVVGVVSVGDILKSRIAEKDQEAAVLRDIARLSLIAAAPALE
jgi:signal-transduction protein with cAMP-binding, CBS, and nucleotidyltransferase domain